MTGVSAEKSRIFMNFYHYQFKNPSSVNKQSQWKKSALTTTPVAIILLFSHSIFCHWERGEGRFISYQV